MNDPHIQRMLEFVASCGDAKKLRQLAQNADQKGEVELAKAARLKLYSVLPGEQPGTIEYAVWQSIYALEDVLKSVERRFSSRGHARRSVAKGSRSA